MKEFQTDHVLNLPDAYRKDANSNNFKILEIERTAVNGLRETLTQVFEAMDINNAKGKTLDMYGERVGQERGVATDDQYLLMIKARIVQNLSNGSLKSVTESICYTLNCDPSQVYIIEKDDPCAIEIVALPLDIIVTAGMTANQTVALIKRLLPVGTTLETFLFEGTFEFSDSENEYDAEKGFCDIEGGDLGGYLGVTAGEENEAILPI